MARAYASTIIEAPVGAVWAMARDFGGLGKWLEAARNVAIEDGLPASAVGCVRAFELPDGTKVRERLLTLDDARYTCAYNFETPAFPVGNYVAVLELIPVTAGDKTFAQWSATFDEAPADSGKYVDIISKAVFAAGLAALATKTAGQAAPEGDVLWQGWRPAKVFCSSVIGAPRARVWERVRDFAGMGGWHEDVSDMHMLAGARGDQVGGTRDFSILGGHLKERLTYLSDLDHAFRYTIDESPMPWMQYHAGARFYPVTSDDTTFAVWTADWVASPVDDVQLIPDIHRNVFQKAFDTLDRQLRQP